MVKWDGNFFTQAGGKKHLTSIKETWSKHKIDVEWSDNWRQANQNSHESPAGHYSTNFVQDEEVSDDNENSTSAFAMSHSNGTN